MVRRVSELKSRQKIEDRPSRGRGMDRVNYVEPGRVICLPQQKGHLAAIVDLIDMNRVMVSGAVTGRVVVQMRRIELTPYKIPIERGMGHKKVMEIFKKSNVVALFRNSNRGRQLLKQKMKRTMTDFERFELQVLKKKRSRLIKREYTALLKGRQEELKKKSDARKAAVDGSKRSKARKAALAKKPEAAPKKK
mmetsp:Transcript_93916/g.130368  ORF Transcript_93916/g.130368 Transcript_93916/m.130368 type:complete len:193 (+) Transcript_93916:28-606(+)